jgi:hypothetical protein
MDWLSAEEKWPKHPEKNWRPVLLLAKRSGWSLKKLNSHAFARISCSPNSSKERCEIKIYISGVSSDSFSKTAQRIISRCEHG